MERMKYDFNFLNSNQSDGIGNRISLDYDVIFSNIQNNIYENGKYYVSSGVAVYNSKEEVAKLRKHLGNVLFTCKFSD